MVGIDFYFNDRWLSEFNMIMAKPSDTINSGLNKEIIKGNSTVNKKKPIHYGTKYSEVLTVPFFIVKNPKSQRKRYDVSHQKISEGHLRKILAWLTSPTSMKKLKVLYNGKHFIEMYGTFNTITPYQFSGLNGLYLTFTCDSPYAYKSKEINLVGNSSTEVVKKFNCDSDELEDVVYPVITINPHNTNASGSYSIKNITTNKTMTFTLPACSEAVIDTELKRVTADGNVLSFSDLGWEISEIYDFNGVGTGTYNLYWFNLLPKLNEFSVLGNADFKLSMKIPMKVGGLI